MLIKLLNRLGLWSFGYIFPLNFQHAKKSIPALPPRILAGSRYDVYLIYGSPGPLDYIS
jgi:hypothetical protein